MSQNITQLALKFSKLISLGEPTPEELDTITGKNVPQRVLVSWELKNKLSQLVDNWRNRTEVIAIKKAWQGLMANGVSSPDGIMVYGGGNLTPMLNALAALGALAQDPKTGTPEVELGEIHDMYVAFSQLKPSQLLSAPVTTTAPKAEYNFDVLHAQQILNSTEGPYHYSPKLDEDGRLGRFTRAALKWVRDNYLKDKNKTDAETIQSIIAGDEVERKKNSPTPVATPTWGDSKTESPPPTEASRLADKFEKLGSELPVVNIDEPWWGKSSMFAVSITTVNPKMSRTAMLSFMHQLESSPYRAMIKYVQDHRDDGRLLIAFREPMSKEAVLKICNSLSLSFSHHDDDKFFAGGDDELIVTDIDVESYSVYPVKETLAFTIAAKSPEDASALADELKRFARIKDTRVQGNVVQVTFKESSSVSELRSMCEKLSRIYKSINQIDIQSLTIGEQ
jgi:hypothetical protein